MRFLATGGDSLTVREELRALETRLQGFRVELAELERTASVSPPRVHRTWILAQLAHLEDLLERDPVRAKIEIMKHLNSELTIFARPSLAGERRAEVVGRVKANGLLAEQEAVRLELVARLDMQNATPSLRRTGSTFVEAEARDRIPKGT